MDKLFKVWHVHLNEPYGAKIEKYDQVGTEISASTCRDAMLYSFKRGLYWGSFDPSKWDPVFEIYRFHGGSAFDGKSWLAPVAITMDHDRYLYELFRTMHKLRDPRQPGKIHKKDIDPVTKRLMASALPVHGLDVCPVCGGRGKQIKTAWFCQKCNKLIGGC